jgi:riboflavin synthase
VFTGLVSDIGVIERVSSTAAGRELRIKCAFTDLTDGESVAVNGACLTVREKGAGWFTCAAVENTLAVTAIGDWKVGTRVNLERALRPADRFGGHFVQGHVDGTARVTSAHLDGDSYVIDLAIPGSLPELMVERGSVAIDGVSLTIMGLPAPDTIRVSIIEYTRRHTTLGALNAGDAVHVEADMIAKHVRAMLAPHKDS